MKIQVVKAKRERGDVAQEQLLHLVEVGEFAGIVAELLDKIAGVEG